MIFSSRPKIYEDELLYSYLQRVCASNGIRYADLLKMEIPFIILDDNIKLAKLYDCDVYLRNIMKDLGYSLSSEMEILREHSTFKAIAPFAHDGLRSRFLQHVDVKPELCDDTVTHRKYIRNPRICPECQKEKPYYRLTHQIPVIKTCPVHGCSLVENGKPLVTDNLEEAQADTAYWMSVYNIGICNYSFSQIRDMLLSKARYRNGNYDEMIHPLFLDFKSYADISRSYRMIYPDPAELAEDMKLIPSREIGFLRYARRHGYRLVSDYSEDMVIMKHEACGHQFITTPEALFDGIECYKCYGYQFTGAGLNKYIESVRWKITE